MTNIPQSQKPLTNSAACNTQPIAYPPGVPSIAGVRIIKIETVKPMPHTHSTGATRSPKAVRVAKKTTTDSKLRTMALKARLVDFGLFIFTILSHQTKHRANHVERPGNHTHRALPHRPLEKLKGNPRVRLDSDNLSI